MELHKFEIVITSKKKKSDQEIMALIDKIEKFIDEMDSCAEVILARMKVNGELPKDIEYKFMERI